MRESRDMRPDTPLRGILGGALTLAACALFALFLNYSIPYPGRRIRAFSHPGRLCTIFS